MVGTLGMNGLIVRITEMEWRMVLKYIIIQCDYAFMNIQGLFL